MPEGEKAICRGLPNPEVIYPVSVRVAVSIIDMLFLRRFGPARSDMYAYVPEGAIAMPSPAFP